MNAVQASHQLADADVVRADALHWRDNAVQHMVFSVVIAHALDRGDVARVAHHADLPIFPAALFLPALLEGDFPPGRRWEKAPAQIPVRHWERLLKRLRRPAGPIPFPGWILPPAERKAARYIPEPEPIATGAYPQT